MKRTTQPRLFNVAPSIPKLRPGQPFEVEGRRWKGRQRPQEAPQGPISPEVLSAMGWKRKPVTQPSDTKNG